MVVAANNFGVVDTILFVGSLMVAIAVGVYYAYKDRNKSSLDNYYYAGKKISPIAVGFSCAVTFISSITVLSIPVMTYTRGTVIVWYFATNIVAMLPGVIYFIPLIHRLQLPSIFEYLELRFHSVVKKACTVVFCFYQIMWMAIATYLTAIALNIVSPMSVSLSVILTICICAFYTTLGGIKAVVWVDTIQSFIMAAGIIAVTIQTSISIGGMGEGLEAMAQKGLNNFWNFNPDITVSYSFWSLVVGLGPAWSSYYCTNQSLTQRLQSCKNARDSRIACLVSFVISSSFLALSALNGVVMFKYFEGCDPVKSGEIALDDQLIPLLVIRLFKHVPGISGLFVAAAYSGMLSTVSSGINSLSVLILEVFIRPVYSRPITDVTGMKISRCLGLILGLSVMAATFLVGKLSTISMHLISIIDSAFSGPLVGVYLSGMLIPWTNRKGGLFGLVLGMGLNLWIIIGQLVWGKTTGEITVEKSIENCSASVLLNGSFANNTTSMYNSTFMTTPVPEVSYRPYLADTLYQVSLPFLGVIGLCSTFLFAVLISAVTGFQKAEDADPSLFIPLVHGKRFPKKVLKFFRFGVPEYEQKFEPPSTEMEELQASKLLDKKIIDHKA